MPLYFNAIKTLLIYNTNQGGVTEAHYNVLDKTFDDAAASARFLGQLRLALMGNGVTLQAIRISDLRDPNGAGPAQRTFRSQLIPLFILGKGVGTYRPQPATSLLTGLTPVPNGTAVVAGQPVLYGRDVDPDQVQTAIMAKYKAGLQAGHWFMGGIPDGVSDTGTTGGNNPADNFWLARFSDYRDELLGIVNGAFVAAKWGSKLRIIAPPPQFAPTPITTWTQPGGPGTNLFANWASAGGPAFTLGQKVQITKARMILRDLGTVNGTYPVVAASTTVGAVTSMELGGTSSLDPNNIKTDGFITQVDYAIVPYSDVQIGRQVSHRRGRFYSNFRGRTTRRTA